MAKALPVTVLEPFNLHADNSSVGIRWERWMKSFQYYVTGSGITDKAQKRALLLHLVGTDVQEIFETLENSGDDKDFDQAVLILNQYFKPKKNVSFERHKFTSELQSSNETVQDYVTRLKYMSLSCEFPDKDERIRDQVVDKCNSNVMRRKFLQEKVLAWTNYWILRLRTNRLTQVPRKSKLPTAVPMKRTAE